MRKFFNQQDMKQSNIADIFNLIRDKGSITRRQIAACTNMSWGAVSNITSWLIEHSYITETKAESEGGAGRIPAFLEVNSSEHFAIGLDINSSGFRAVLVNLKNEILGEWKHEVDFSDRNVLLNEICTFAENVFSYAGEHHILCIGIAMQGLVNSEEGVSIAIPQCKNWHNVPLASMLSERFHVPVYLEHDPNCILYSASLQKQFGDTLLLRVDNGIGMAVMLGGKTIDKPGIFEIGHTIVQPNGEICSCGRQGCLELYASQKGISRLSHKSFDELATAARNNDTTAMSYFTNMAEHLAFALSNVAHLLNIENIVLCGDMWNYKDLFFGHFLDRINSYCAKKRLTFSFTDIQNATLGAALISIERSLEDTIITKGS